MAATASSVKIHLVPLGLLLRISHRQQQLLASAASVEPAIFFGGGRGEGDIVALKNYMNTQYFGEIGIDRYSAAKVHCHIRHWQLQPLGAISQVLLLDCVLLPLSLQVRAVKHLSEEWHKEFSGDTTRSHQPSLNDDASSSSLSAKSAAEESPKRANGRVGKEAPVEESPKEVALSQSLSELESRGRAGKQQTKAKRGNKPVVEKVVEVDVEIVLADYKKKGGARKPRKVPEQLPVVERQTT